jgi:hypothetical protein
MPIKCAGAPLIASYLSGDHWHRTGRQNDFEIDFFNAGPVLFGGKEYLPALMKYIEKHKAQLHFQHRLTRVDGPARTAWFTKANADGTTETVETAFDLIHVVPSQVVSAGIGFPPYEVKDPVLDALKRSDFMDHFKCRIFLSQFEAVSALTAPQGHAAILRSPLTEAEPEVSNGMQLAQAGSARLLG